MSQKYASSTGYHCPEVSVLCLTHNHRRYIAECLKSFVGQKTSFPFEVVVHDDASDDGTTQIVQEWASRYPDIIKPIIQQTNQLSKIGGQVVLIGTRACRGSLVAYCEGDDRWTDPNKLQKQRDYLLKNTDCSACIHQTRLISSDGNVIEQNYFHSWKSKYCFEDCLLELNSCYASCSLMFRKNVLDNPPKWLLRNLSDMFLELQIARHGELGFIDLNMADYRYHEKGTWSGLKPIMHTFYAMHRLQLLLEYPEFDSYRKQIERRILSLSERLMTIQECEKQVKVDRIMRRPLNRLAKNIRRLLNRK